MRIFVTGGTGFIGGPLVHRLADANHQITCLVRKSSNISVIMRPGVELVVGDVTDFASVREIIKGHDCIINLANIYSFWESNPRIFRQVNIEGTRNVLEAALEAGIPKVVHISTCGVYGKPSDDPYTEDSEIGPTHFSEYFRTKYEGDQIAWDLYNKKKLPLVMIYPMAVLGTGDPKATGQYIRRIMQRRMPARILEDRVFTFVHVKDVVEVIFRATMKEGNVGERYFAGKFKYTFGEINHMIGEISGVPIPRFRLPDFSVMPCAWMLTKLADLIKKPPIWGMAIDQIRTMKEGVRADGSKSERELCIEYTPIRDTIKDAIDHIRNSQTNK